MKTPGDAPAKAENRIPPPEKITCKDEARRWVHRYAAGGALFAASPVPVPASAMLAALETHMVSFIGTIYGDPLGGPVTSAAGATLTALGPALKALVSSGTKFVPILGPVLHAAVAATTIETLGQAIIAHYERKHPGKVFTQDPKKKK